MPVDFAFVGEGEDGVRSELGAVIGDGHHGFCPEFDDRRQFPRHSDAGQGCVGDECEAFAGAVVDHGQHAEQALVPSRACQHALPGNN